MICACNNRKYDSFSLPPISQQRGQLCLFEISLTEHEVCDKYGCFFVRTQQTHVTSILSSAWDLRWVWLSQLNSFEMFTSGFALKSSPKDWGFVALSAGAGRGGWGVLPLPVFGCRGVICHLIHLFSVAFCLQQALKNQHNPQILTS